MRDYMIAAMKITPDSPTFTEGRDAVLAVALAADPNDYTLLRAAFSKRGWGPLAVSPDRFDGGWTDTQSPGHVGATESFENEATSMVMHSIAMDTRYSDGDTNEGYCDNDMTWDEGETVRFTIQMRNAGTNPTTGIKAMFSSSADITFDNGGMVEFADTAQWNEVVTGQIEAKLNSATPYQWVDLNLSFSGDGDNLVLPQATQDLIPTNYGHRQRCQPYGGRLRKYLTPSHTTGPSTRLALPIPVTLSALMTGRWSIPIHSWAAASP